MIRPYLVERCYECHATHGKREQGLAVDWAGGLREGGDSGPAVVPGNLQESILMTALRHGDDLLMPKGGPKATPDIVMAFERWIALGAPDPRRTPPSADELAKATSWPEIFARRKQWWSLQPIARPANPPRSAAGKSWLAESDHPVDRFLAAKLHQSGVQPAGEADPDTLLRRATFALTGLPPTPAERRAFLADTTPDRWERLVDRLIASPAFAEHWARHWLDCVRYCETHGSEGDPKIPFAWRYRDWCIRAIRDDVPIDRFIREQVAGDLLADPRIDPATGINESALGIGHLRMVPHGYTPTDPLDECVTFTDNQIDVISKAFLGMTVSCARCHDHKFDAISQADFYALFGTLVTCRPAVIHVDAPGRRQQGRDELKTLKARIQAELAAVWLTALDQLPGRLAAAVEAEAVAYVEAGNPPAGTGKTPEERETRARVDRVLRRGQLMRAADHPLAAVLRLEGLAGDARQQAWDQVRRETEGAKAAPASMGVIPPPATWFRHGAGLDVPSAPGEFRIESEGDRVITQLLPAGIHSALLVPSDGGILHSPRFTVESDAVRLLVSGSARARVVFHNYPRTGLLYPSVTLEDGPLRWVTINVGHFRGRQAHVEIAAHEDGPLPGGASRSFFSVAGVAHGQGLADGALAPASLVHLLRERGADAPAAAPADRIAGCSLYAPAVRSAIEDWRDGRATDPQVRLLDALVSLEVLPTDAARVPALGSLVASYRTIAAAIPPPTRAAGVLEGTVVNQPLFVRGNLTQPAAAVPRRFLEAIDPRPFSPADSGRRELADRLVAAENPLTPRVFVNRVWHHLFGRGIVASVDTFGQMGDLPTHPELLDFLASQFVSPSADAPATAAMKPWSLHSLVRLLATSRAFRLAVQPTESARRLDPANTLFSHARLRRLEGESIRDAMLAAAGTLDRGMFGPSAAPTQPRRSVYLGVIRNSPDPFLAAFDPPSLQSTQGRRDVSHVPAQALVLLNGPFTRAAAAHRAKRLVTESPSLSPDDRVRTLFVETLGREPDTGELAESRLWLDDLATEHGVPGDRIAGAEPIWADFVHGLFNLEEFIHVD
ncbi:MAG: PSD1 and planctomycete cytochrome C domain-containing protein [Pirellulales bacterium]